MRFNDGKFAKKSPLSLSLQRLIQLREKFAIIQRVTNDLRRIIEFVIIIFGMKHFPRKRITRLLGNDLTAFPGRLPLRSETERNGKMENGQRIGRRGFVATEDRETIDDAVATTTTTKTTTMTTAAL